MKKTDWLIISLFLFFCSSSYALDKKTIPELAVGFWKKDDTTDDVHRYPLLAVSTDPQKTQWSYAGDVYNHLPSHLAGELKWGACNETICITGGYFGEKLHPMHNEPMVAISTDDARMHWDYVKLPTPPDYKEFLTIKKTLCTSSMCMVGLSYDREKSGELQEERRQAAYFAYVTPNNPTQWSISGIDFKNISITPGLSYSLHDFDCNEKYCLASFHGVRRYTFLSPKDSHYLFFARSIDQGKTWSVVSQVDPSDEKSKAFQQSPNYNSQVKCKEDVCLATSYYSYYGHGETMWAWVFYSKDRGDTWSYTKIPGETKSNSSATLSLINTNNTWLIKGVNGQKPFTFINNQNGEPSSWVYQLHENAFERAGHLPANTTDCREGLCVFPVNPRSPYYGSSDLMVGQYNGAGWNWRLLKNPLEVESDIGKISCEDSEHCTIIGSFPYIDELPSRPVLFKMTKAANSGWAFTSLGENISNLPPHFFQGGFLYRW